MATKRLVLVVVGVCASTSFAACVSDQNGGTPTDDGGLSFDGTSPGSEDGAVSNDGTIAEDGAMLGGDSGAQEASTTNDGAPNGSDAGGDAAAPPSGTLDHGFNGTGSAIGNPPLLPDGGAAKLFSYVALAADAQGRLLVTGSVLATGDYEQVYAWRFLASGAADTSFGASGQTTFLDPGDNDYPTGLCVDGSGNVLVAGYSLSSGTELWRFTSTGAVDTTFGGTGEIDAPGGGHGYAIACTAAGTLIAGGAPPYGATVWRYTSAGALDTANFAPPNGFVQDETEFGANTAAQAMAVGGNGDIVLAGSVSNGAQSFGTGVWRFSGSGGLDAGLGGSTLVVPTQAFDAGGVDAGGFTWTNGVGVAVDSSNDIAVVDTSGVARLTSTGALDTTFAGGVGRLELPAPAAAASSSVQVFGVAIDGEGRILVVGAAGLCMTVWRLTSAGALDTTFGTGGSFVSHETAGGTLGDQGNAIFVDSSNRAYVGGTSTLASGEKVPVVWRLTP